MPTINERIMNKLKHLKDVKVTDVSHGQILVYNSNTGKWENKTQNLSFVQTFDNSAIWTIQHNMDKYPAVTILDENGDQCFGIITYNDKNSLTITFSTDIKGTVYLN